MHCVQSAIPKNWKRAENLSFTQRKKPGSWTKIIEPSKQALCAPVVLNVQQNELIYSLPQSSEVRMIFAILQIKYLKHRVVTRGPETPSNKVVRP
jgi:hypothetical protein